MRHSRSSRRITRRQVIRWAAWFALANAGLMALLAVRSFTFSALPADTLSRVYLALILPGHFVLLTFLLLPLAALPVPVVPRSWAFVYVTGLYSLHLMLLLIDTQVFSLYRFHLNGMVWNILTSGVVTELLPFTWLTYLTAGLLLALLVAVEAAVGWGLWRVLFRRRSLYGYRVALLLVALVFSGQFMHAWADAAGYTAITRQMRYLPWLNGLTARRFFEEQGWKPRTEAIARTVPQARSGLSYPLTPLTCAAPGQPLNVLFIVVDGWRADTLDPVTTPQLMALAQRSQRFLNNYSSSDATRHGIFGLMYGLYANYWDPMLAEERGSVLVHQARVDGYRFGIYGSASVKFPEFDRTVFAEIRDQVPLETTGGDPAARDRTITDRFLRFLDEGDPARPFFGFLFYDSSHAYTFPPGFEGPYQPQWEVVNFLELNNGFDPRPFFNRYRNAVNYVDGLAGEVIATLKDKGLLERTVVVATGDHGEEFNENRNNYWGHNSNFSQWETQTPMVLYWPGTAPRTYTHTTSHVDVVPTLMEKVFGCTTPFDQYSNGRSLFDDSPRPYVVSGNYNVLAIIEPERVTELDMLGRTTTFDAHWKELPDARPPAAYLGAVLKDMGRFYRR
jgi:hypothetical protein